MWTRPARDELLYWQERLSGAGADEVVFRGLVDSPDAGGPERGNPGILCERDALPVKRRPRTNADGRFPSLSRFAGHGVSYQ